MGGAGSSLNSSRMMDDDEDEVIRVGDFSENDQEQTIG